MPEYQMITTYIDNSNYAVDKECGHDVTVHKIYAVHDIKGNEVVHLPQKPQLIGASLNRHLLFHGTKIENVPEILRMGFTMDPNRVTNGDRYGLGIYLADRVCFAAEYAHFYEDYKYSNNAVIFLNEVALGKQFADDNEPVENHGDSTALRNIPDNVDSVIGRGRYIPDPKDQKVLDDGIIVPSGKTVQSDPKSHKNMAPQYNELRNRSNPLANRFTCWQFSLHSFVLKTSLGGAHICFVTKQQLCFRKLADLERSVLQDSYFPHNSSLSSRS
ncbi:poly(ADP-ribose) polymerase catalytic domain-containing protein [Ditylenchus destructor]|uniref:Poly [ADP-ribose] polymerase n=1 Tax=Ditylenchus destructor TaxID=166010 RepID=A0AAD4MHJ6_9BILA|nr:poly(ADP-ribose) polymerase catalytic domain-containing protein [Ditylenchus destructor]